jgi:hypothetical protein
MGIHSDSMKGTDLNLEKRKETPMEKQMVKEMHLG